MAKFTWPLHIRLVPIDEGQPESQNKLYFINLGGYLPNQFGEFHSMHFVVSDSMEGAKKRAEELYSDYVDGHRDDLIDLNDAIELSSIDGYRVTLTKSDASKEIVYTNGYFPIRDYIVSEHHSNSI